MAVNSNNGAARNSQGAEEKRKLILAAATEVFARKGFHSCRISDIASRAGVAYGLVYHYFENKEEILNTLFKKHWGLLNQLLDDLAGRDCGLAEKLNELVSLIIDAYRLVPDLIHVMVIEIARSTRQLSRPRIKQYERSFETLAGILAQHQQRGEIRPDLDCRLLAHYFFGSLELVLTGYLLHTLEPGNDAEMEAVKHQLVDCFLTGVAPARQPG